MIDSGSNCDAAACEPRAHRPPDGVRMLRRGPPSERRASVMLEEEAACCEEALSPDEPGEGGLSSDAELRAAAQRQQGGDGSRMVERMDSEEGTRELLDQLDQRIRCEPASDARFEPRGGPANLHPTRSSPSFLQTLRALPSDAYHTLPDGPSPKASPSCKKRGALSWLRGRAEKPTQSVGAEPVFVEPAAADESCGGEFVIIASDEVLESVVRVCAAPPPPMHVSTPLILTLAFPLRRRCSSPSSSAATRRLPSSRQRSCRKSFCPP